MITIPRRSGKCDQENIQFFHNLSYFFSENIEIFPVLLSVTYNFNRSATSLKLPRAVGLPYP